MKKYLFSLALFMSALDLFAQADLPSYGYSYQAIVRDDKGEPAVNQVVQLRFQILNSTNQKLYEEIHAATTDGFGRVDMVLGSGVAIFGKFDTLNWGTQKHFLDMAIKMNGVADWADLGKKEIVLQPFARRNGDWVNVGDSMLYSKKRIGIGGINNSPSDVILQVSNPQKPTTFLVGDYKAAHYVRLSTSAFQNGHGEIQAVKNGNNWGDLILNPKGGNIGIGVSNPDSKLEINGDLHLDNNARIYFQAGPTDPNYFIESYPISGSAGMRVKGFGGVTLTTAVGDILHVVQDRVGIGMGTSLPQAKLHVNGDIRGKIIIVEGSDRTHRFNTTTGAQLPAGTVVVFDKTQPGKIRPCTTAYDRNIPGIISDESGKGKYHPGIIHEQEDTKNGSPVALDGTVEAFAVGPIAIGDYLTTSKVPGHAMRTKNRRKSEGAEIGRALTPLAKGKKGKVEVFVGRD